MLRRAPFRLFVASSIRLCTTGAKPAGGEAGPTTSSSSSTETQQSQNQNQQQPATSASTSTALDHHKGKGLDPSDDPVWEYARAALTREGRQNQIEAVVWDENTSYTPILARGQKNVYDITSDIPQHVQPQIDWHWYQSRQYFDMMRDRKPTWRRMLETLLVFGGIGVLCGIVAFTRIWLMQPKEVQQMREEIVALSYGRVLELGAGHGQNVGQYPYAVHEIVMMDQSPQLLNQIRYRLPKTAYPKYEIRQGKVEDLHNVPEASFDCVIDMFGLCHYKDPVMVLRQLQRIVKPTGTLLLLEHGRSPYFPVNWVLDYFADRHNINTHGCSWNRPMMEYFQEARLTVKEIRNMHYGTTYYLVAYPENLDQLKEEIAKQSREVAAMA